MSVSGICRCCSSISELDQGICGECVRLHGPRVAQLLARCEVDAHFKSVCLARLPEPLRSRFASALSAKCLAGTPGPGLHFTRARVQKLRTA